MAFTEENLGCDRESCPFGRPVALVGRQTGCSRRLGVGDVKLEVHWILSKEPVALAVGFEIFGKVFVDPINPLS